MQMPCYQERYVQHHVKLNSNVHNATTQICGSLTLMLPFKAFVVKYEDLAMSMIAVTPQGQ